jgi:hypothetical protein
LEKYQAKLALARFLRRRWYQEKPLTVKADSPVLSLCRNQGHHGKITGIIKIIFDFTSAYICTVTPRSHPAHTSLKSPSHVKVFAAAPLPIANIHPTTNHPSNFN